jgi:16S rRNA (uracil1498-N3)-methyltransferase
MGRHDVTVQLGAVRVVDRELRCAVTLAVGMPANDRMDALVEKATELGVAQVQPLQCERSVLRLDGERARRRQAHWQAIAEAASEQSGRARVPRIEPVLSLRDWLQQATRPALALLLSPDRDAPPLRQVAAGVTASSLCALSGPEGGLSAAEEAAALAAGFVATSLGPRVLRADTAPLALLAWVGLSV